MNETKVLMLNADVGNVYIPLLCKALKKAGIDISLVVTKDKINNRTTDYPLLPISPLTAKSVSKYKKFFNYFS